METVHGTDAVFDALVPTGLRAIVGKCLMDARGDEPDPRARELDGRHEGKRGERRPQHAVAELRARDRVGGDAAGIVVRGAGDKPRPQDLEVADDGIAARRGGHPYVRARRAVS